MRWMRLVKIVLGGFVVLLLILLAAGWIHERTARSSALRNFPPPGKLVSLDTHSLHLDCRGEGSPTIVLEAGMDPFGSLSWSLQHDRLAAISRTCAYDRAGIAWSEIGPRPRSGDRIVSELDELLRRAGESGPLVLVAQSMGGVYARLFAATHRDRVAGVVLIESSHPEQFERMPVMGFRPPPALLIRAVPLLRQVGVMRHVMTGELRVSALPEDKQQALRAVSAGSIATVLSEFGQIQQTLALAGEVRSLGDLPLLVLGIGTAPDASKIPNVDQAEADRGFALWLELQGELAALSSRGRLETVPGATHYMQLSKPDIVVEAVSAFIEEVRVGLT